MRDLRPQTTRAARARHPARRSQRALPTPPGWRSSHECSEAWERVPTSAKPGARGSDERGRAQAGERDRTPLHDRAPPEAVVNGPPSVCSVSVIPSPTAFKPSILISTHFAPTSNIREN